MKTVYDIQQYLKRFGTFVYVGNRVADLEIMEFEIRELYHSKLMEPREFTTALLILRHEIQLEKEKNHNKDWRN